MPGFSIGHFGGRPLALRWGQYVFLTPRRLDHAEEFFRRHGGKVVTVARFVEGLRQASGIIAGISRMRWPRFVIFNVLGAVFWVGVWCALGYAAGSHVGALYHQIARYEVFLGGAVLVLIMVYRAQAMAAPAPGSRVARRPPELQLTRARW